MSIQSFQCAETESFFNGRTVKKFEGFKKVAMRKLAMLDAAKALNDLRVPPANRLEPLRGDREGQHSIRVNDQFRVCFIWADAGPTNVEICDYH
ncbi:excinuclease ABC subunit A [Lysobacter concretionis Ko07 = DSM 16239]|uniref:Excinuclease ABC subunit A n=1 Tax=Lysobacter concretionis Ko07 = DSM 16239 TaxID=1122185 RepID=A0A0A0ES02_9GAMM|nr:MULTISPECIES: type II toxin-antitoxin system RelE/ParE family toxin [Lysobacter]KGM53020.1 excinuclease ABC subunit A [Lysobacter concretionis Ko07 = DSM 16239]QOD91458.1 type II toxin-antitoxin system RelE/ParE family toxin [Lysobacter sp. CW239]